MAKIIKPNQYWKVKYRNYNGYIKTVKYDEHEECWICLLSKNLDWNKFPYLFSPKEFRSRASSAEFYGQRYNYLLKESRKALTKWDRASRKYKARIYG